MMVLPFLFIFLTLLLLPYADPYRIHDPDTGAPLTAAYFVPYDPGFVGRVQDPDNPRRYRVNEGNPFSLAQPNIFRGVLPRQDCPNMIGPFEHGVYYCTSKEAGYCDRRSGACFCSKGYQGKDCSICRSTHMRNTTTGTCDPKVICPNDCSGAGSCDTATGMCTCRKNRRGIDCSLKYCRLLHRWCTNCNEELCQTCEQGYFVDIQGIYGGIKGTCKPCTVHDPRCIECDAQSCLTCADPLLSSVRRSGRRRLDPLLPWDEDERLLSRTLPFGTQSPYAFEEAEPFILITDKIASETMGVQRSIWSPAQACFSLLGIQQQSFINVSDSIFTETVTNDTTLLRIGVISSSDLSTDGNSGQVRRYYINCSQLMYMDSYYGYGPTGNEAIEGPVEGGIYGSKLTPIIYPPGLLDIDDGSSIIDVYGEPLNMSRLVDMVEEFLILTGGGVGYGDGSSVLITGKGLNVTWWKDLKGFRRDFIRGDLYTNTTIENKTLYVLPNYYNMRRRIHEESIPPSKDTVPSVPYRDKIERFLMDINMTKLTLNNEDLSILLKITTVPRNSNDYTTNSNPLIPIPLLNASALACEQGYHERKDDSWTCSHVRISHVVCGHPGTINFNSPTYAVLESDQYLAVTIQRSGGGLGRVSVRIQLEHETTDDSDVSLTAQYTTSRELVFEEGVVSLTFRITIHDDRLIEPIGEAGRANYSNQIPLQTVFLDTETNQSSRQTQTMVAVGSFAAALFSSFRNISSLSSAAKSMLDGKLYTSGGYKRLGEYRYLTTVLQPGVSSESNALARTQGGLDTLSRMPTGFVRQSRKIYNKVINDTLTITVLPDTDILQPSSHLENQGEWNRSIVYFSTSEYLNFIRLFDEPVIMNTSTGNDNYINTGFPNTGVYSWHNRLGPHETFRLRLHSPTGGAHLGAQSFTTVAIIDDDTYRVLPATTLAEGELLTSPTAAVLIDAIARGTVGSSLLPVDTDMNDIYYQRARTSASLSDNERTLPYRKVRYEELTGKQNGRTESSQSRILPYAIVGEETAVYIHPYDGAGLPITSSRYTALHFDAVNAPDIIPASLLGEEKFLVALEPLPDVSISWLISHLVRILTIEDSGSTRLNANIIDNYSLSSILWYMLDSTDKDGTDRSDSKVVRDTSSLGIPARVPFSSATGLPNLTSTSWATVPLIYSEPDDEDKYDTEFSSFITNIGSRMTDGIGNTVPLSTFMNPSSRQINGIDQSRQRLQQVFDRWTQDYELSDSKNSHVQTWKDVLKAISSLLWNYDMGPGYSYQSGHNNDQQSGTFTNDDALAFTAVLGLWPGSSTGSIATSGDGAFGKVTTTAEWWKAGFNDSFISNILNNTGNPSSSTPLDIYLASASSTIVNKYDIGTYKATLVPVRSGLTQVSIYHALPGGLRGSYYGNSYFLGNPLLQRIDSIVNFTWGLGPIFEVKTCAPCGGIEKEGIPYGDTATVSQPGMCGITGVGASDFALNHTGNVLLPFGSVTGFSPQMGFSPLQSSPFDREYLNNNIDNDKGGSRDNEEEEHLMASLMDQTAFLTHRPDSMTVSSSYSRGGRRPNYRTVSGTSPSGLGSSSTGCTTGSWTDDASVRWNGKIGIPSNEESGYYTFVIFADDHVRLWIDNSLVIDAWGGKAGTGSGSSNTRRFMNDDQSTTISARTGSDHSANMYMDDYEDNPNVLNKRRSRYDIVPSTLSLPGLTNPLVFGNVSNSNGVNGNFQGPLPKVKDSTTVCTYARLDSGGNRAEGSASIPVHTDSLFAMDIVCMDTSHSSTLPSSLNSVKDRDRVWTNPADQQTNKYPRTTTMYHELSGLLNSQRSIGGLNYFDQAYVGLRSPPVRLQKNQLYDIILEYRDMKGWAGCRLAWITPSMLTNSSSSSNDNRFTNSPLVPVTVPSDVLYSLRHISGSPSLTYIRPGIGYAEGVSSPIYNDTNTTMGTNTSISLPDYTCLEVLLMDTRTVLQTQNYNGSRSINSSTAFLSLGSTLGSSKSYGSYAEGEGLLNGIAGEVTTFTIYSRDMYGNNRKGESIGDVYWIQAVLLSPDPTFDVTMDTIPLDGTINSSSSKDGKGNYLSGIGNITLHTITMVSRIKSSSIRNISRTIIYGNTEYNRSLGIHNGYYTGYEGGIYSLSTRLRTDWRTYTYIMNSPSVLRMIPNLPSPRTTAVWGQGIHPTGLGVVVGNPFVIFTQPRDEYMNSAVIDIGKDLEYYHHPNVRHLYPKGNNEINNNHTEANSLIIVEDLSLLPSSLRIHVDAYYEGNKLTVSSTVSSSSSSSIPFTVPNPDTLPYSSIRAKTIALLLPFPSSYNTNDIVNDWNGTVLDMEGIKVVLQFNSGILYPLPSYTPILNDTVSEGVQYIQQNKRLLIFISTYVPIIAGSYRVSVKYSRTNAIIAAAPYYTVVRPTVSSARTSTLMLRSPSSQSYFTYSPYSGSKSNNNNNNTLTIVPPHVYSSSPAEFEVTIYDRFSNLRIGQNKKYTTIHWNIPSATGRNVTTEGIDANSGQTYTKRQETFLPLDIIDPLSDNLTAYVEYTVHTPFGPVNYTRPAEIQYNGCCNATYKILSPCGGLSCRLSVFLRNKPLKYSPFIYTRSSSMVSSKFSYYWGPGTVVNTVGKRSWFIIQLRDDDGNPVLNQWSQDVSTNMSSTVTNISSSEYVQSLINSNRLQVRIRRVGGVRADQVESSISVGSSIDTIFTRQLQSTPLDTWYRKRNGRSISTETVQSCGGLDTWVSSLLNDSKTTFNPFYQSPLDHFSSSSILNSSAWQSLYSKYLSTCPLPSLTVPLQLHTLASYLYQFTNEYNLTIDNYGTMYSDQQLTSFTLPRIQSLKLLDVLRLRNITTRWDPLNFYTDNSTPVTERTKNIRANLLSRLYPSESLPSIPLVPDLPYYNEYNLPREWLYKTLANITIGSNEYTSSIYNGDVDDVWLRPWLWTNLTTINTTSNGTVGIPPEDNHYGYLNDNSFELSVIPDTLNNDQSSSGGYILLSYTTMREGVYEILATLDDSPLTGFVTLPHSSGDIVTSSSLFSSSFTTNVTMNQTTVNGTTLLPVYSSNLMSVILPGPMDATMSIVEGSGTRIGHVGKTTSLTVTARDIYGNRCNRASADTDKLYLRMRPLQDTDNRPVTKEESIRRNLTKIIKVQDITNFSGSYSAEFLPLLAGTSEVEITHLPQSLGLWTEYFAQPFWMMASTLSRNPSQYTYNTVQKQIIATVAATVLSTTVEKSTNLHVMDSNHDNLDTYLSSWYTYGNVTEDIKNSVGSDEQMMEKVQELLSFIPGKPILQRFEPLPYFNWNRYKLETSIQERNPAAVIISETVGWSVRWSGFLSLPVTSLSDNTLRKHIGNALTVPLTSPLLYPETSPFTASSAPLTSSSLRNDTVEMITFLLRVKGGHAVFALRSWDRNYSTAMPHSTDNNTGSPWNKRTYSSSPTYYLGGLNVVGPDESEEIRQEVQSSLPLRAPSLSSLIDGTTANGDSVLSSYSGWIRLIDTQEGIGWLSDNTLSSGDENTDIPVRTNTSVPTGYDEVWSVSLPMQSHAYYGLFIGYSHTGDHNKGSLDNPSQRMIVPCSFSESTRKTNRNEKETCHISMKVLSRTLSSQHISSIPWAKLTKVTSIPSSISASSSIPRLSTDIPLRATDITYRHYTEQAITVPPAFFAPPLVQSVGFSPFTLSIAADKAYAPTTTLVWYIPQLRTVDSNTTNELLKNYEYNTTYENPTFTAEHTVTCFIRIHDQFGNARVYADMAAKDKVYVWAIQVPIEPTKPIIIYPEDITVMYIGKARYRIYFIPRLPGNYRLYVAINPPLDRMSWSRGIETVIQEAIDSNSLAGIHTTTPIPVSSLADVKGPPKIPYFLFSVESSTVVQDSYALSYAYGEGLSIGTAGFSASFYIQLVDTYGNNMTTLPDDERSVSIEHTDRTVCPQGTIPGTPSSPCIPFVDAVFSYTGPLANQFDDSYTNQNDWDPRKERSPNYPFPHPVSNTIEITTYSPYNRSKNTYISNDNSVSMYENSAFVSTIPTNLLIHYRARVSPGLWYIEYIPIAAGTYSVTIFINGLPIQKNPYRINVYPSAPVARYSSIELDPLCANASEALRLKYTSYLSLTLNPDTQSSTTSRLEEIIQGTSSTLANELRYTESLFVNHNGESKGTVPLSNATNYYTVTDPFNGLRPLYRRYLSDNNGNANEKENIRTGSKLGWIGYRYRYPRSTVPLKGLYSTVVNKQIRIPGTGSVVPAPYRETFIPLETDTLMSEYNSINDDFHSNNPNSWSNFANSLYGNYPVMNHFFPPMNHPIAIVQRSIRRPSSIDQGYGITSITEGTLHAYVRTRDIYGSPLRTGNNTLYAELRRANDYRTTSSLFTEFAYFQGIITDRNDGVYRISYTVPLAYNQTVPANGDNTLSFASLPSIDQPEATIETQENLVYGPWIMEIWLLLPTQSETEYIQKDPLRIVDSTLSLVHDNLQQYTRPLLVPSVSTSLTIHQQRLFYRQTRMHGLLGYYWSSDSLAFHIPSTVTSGNENIIQRNTLPTNIPLKNNFSTVTAIDPLSLWRTRVWSAVPTSFSTTMMGTDSNVKNEFETQNLQNFSSVLWTGFVRPSYTGTYSFLVVCDGPCEFTFHFIEDTTDLVRTGRTDTTVSPLTLVIGGGIAGGMRDGIGVDNNHHDAGELWCRKISESDGNSTDEEEYGRRTEGGTPLYFYPKNTSSNVSGTIRNLFDNEQDYDDLFYLYRQEVTDSKTNGCLTILQSSTVYLRDQQAYAVQSYLRRRIGTVASSQDINDTTNTMKNRSSSSPGIYTVFWSYTGTDEVSRTTMNHKYRKIPYNNLYYKGELVHDTPLPVWID